MTCPLFVEVVQGGAVVLYVPGGTVVWVGEPAANCLFRRGSGRP